MKDTTDITQAKNYLDSLDLSYLADAMSSASYPLPRWEREDVIQCLQRYKNFLWLHKLYPNVSLVPTKEIDECWHNHILYTRYYARDCEHLFGHYFHHIPAIPGESDNTLASDYLQTKNLYQQTFHHPINITLSQP